MSLCIVLCVFVFHISQSSALIWVKVSVVSDDLTLKVCLNALVNGIRHVQGGK